MTPNALAGLRVTPRDEGVRFGVRVRPKSSKDAVLGVREGALDLAVHAAPVDGAANEAVRRLLAKALGVKKSALAIVVGETGRQKVVEVSGLSEHELVARLGAGA